MMTRNILLFIVLTTVVSMQCYAQDMVSETRTISPFSKISASSGVDVYITEGNSTSVKVEASYNDLLSEINTEVKNGKLNISRKKVRREKRRNIRLKVYVEANNLTEISASSGSDIYSTGELIARDIKLSASGGSDIKLELKAESIECEATSGSDIDLKGSADFAKLSASSAGDIDMKEMTVNIAEATASSGSDIRIHVTGELKARATSGSDIYYTGSPRVVDKKQSSGGDVTGK